METSKFGTTVGDVFGTIAWLWVFHRFRQDGKVLLGMEHPWEHGHDHAHDHHGASSGKKLSPDEVQAGWQSFSDKALIPGDDDVSDV